jgi:predicted nucleic acid-binding protein
MWIGQAGNGLVTHANLRGRGPGPQPLNHRTVTTYRLRHNLSFYDALYVALAARLNTVLLTGDIRLGQAPQLPCQVELV